MVMSSVWIIVCLSTPNEDKCVYICKCYIYMWLQKLDHVCIYVNDTYTCACILQKLEEPYGYHIKTKS